MNNGSILSIMKGFLFFIIIELYFSLDLPKPCQINFYYDTTLHECVSCPANSIPNENNQCICKIGYKFAYNITNNLLQSFSQQIVCEECPFSSTSSRDRSICLPCVNGTNTITGECLCEIDQIIVEKDISGNYFKEKQCLKCPEGSIPEISQTPYNCISCPIGKIFDTNSNPPRCRCDLTNYIIAGDQCLPIQEVSFITSNYPPNIAKGIGFSQAETADPLVDSQITIASSDTIDYLYLNNAYNCLKKLDNKSCQVLANLCVMQLYDQNSPICKLYSFINDSLPAVSGAPDLGWRQGMPWLYYKQSADKIINSTDKIPFEVSFDPNDNVMINQMKFYLKKYDILGNYLGQELLSTQLQFCSKKYEDGINFRSFGTTIINKCNIDLSVYLNANQTMYFYELFVMDPKSNKLIDIPVMIDNIPNPKASGFGSLNNATTPDNWILTRRFFLIDNLSSLQNLGEFISGKGIPFAIRFPKLIKLIVILQNTSGSKIMTPYLEIFYKAQTQTLISQMQKTLVSFVSEYRMNIQGFIDAAQAIFIVLNILIGIIVVIKMYVWHKLNPPTLSPDNYLLWIIWVFFFKLFEYWGKIIFWFCWIISAYWYVFFKLQYRVFILLPPLNTWWDNYRAFDIIFGIACACYTFYMFYRVYEQSNIDIFFIDWEHDKELLIKNANELRTEKYRGAWRLVSVANQFNRLINERYISLPFSFFWLVFAWWYLDWGLYTNSIPAKSLSVNSPDNYILRHFLGSFILLLCGIGHLIFWFIIQFILPLKKDDFIDLCCVANTSVFILDQSLHGYYIHGQSPSGRSDTNIGQLLEFLEEESVGKAKGRGLVDKDPDNLQTYEVFINYQMRINYDGIFGLQTETMINSAQSRDKIHNQSRIVNFIRALPKSLQHDKIYKLKSYMNSELKERIQNISNQPNKYIREKTKLQRFLNYPPIDLIGNTPDEIVFFKDPNNQFESVLFSGIEWEWYIWNIFVYQMWMLSLDNCAISIYLTFICDRILFEIRKLFCEKNLARKAIIDNKFFM